MDFISELQNYVKSIMNDKDSKKELIKIFKKNTLVKLNYNIASSKAKQKLENFISGAGISQAYLGILMISINEFKKYPIISMIPFENQKKAISWKVTMDMVIKGIISPFSYPFIIKDKKTIDCIRDTFSTVIELNKAKDESTFQSNLIEFNSLFKRIMKNP
ncbi:hypothetical protein ACFCYN_14135 [Gottfriedia sp. NPDC056225]|uniref:hypothetical protein n=1 Tax=Gottfriedia sp. NPDC056225 TaxID=3345751 RepID=UPI0035E2BB04